MKDRLIQFMPNHGKNIIFSCNKLEKTRENRKRIFCCLQIQVPWKNNLKNYLDAVGDNPDYRYLHFFWRGLFKQEKSDVGRNTAGREKASK